MGQIRGSGGRRGLQIPGNYTLYRKRDRGWYSLRDAPDALVNGRGKSWRAGSDVEVIVVEERKGES